MWSHKWRAGSISFCRYDRGCPHSPSPSPLRPPPTPPLPLRHQRHTAPHSSSRYQPPCQPGLSCQSDPSHQKSSLALTAGPFPRSLPRDQRFLYFKPGEMCRCFLVQSSGKSGGKNKLLCSHVWRSQGYCPGLREGKAHHLLGESHTADAGKAFRVHAGRGRQSK